MQHIILYVGMSRNLLKCKLMGGLQLVFSTDSLSHRASICEMDNGSLYEEMELNIRGV